MSACAPLMTGGVLFLHAMHSVLQNLQAMSAFLVHGMNMCIIKCTNKHMFCALEGFLHRREGRLENNKKERIP